VYPVTTCAMVRQDRTAPAHRIQFSVQHNTWLSEETQSIDPHLGCCTYTLSHSIDDLLLEASWQHFTQDAINVLQSTAALSCCCARECNQQPPPCAPCMQAGMLFDGACCQLDNFEAGRFRSVSSPRSDSEVNVNKSTSEAAPKCLGITFKYQLTS
jgi:hypothetical protein